MALKAYLFVACLCFCIGPLVGFDLEKKPNIVRPCQLDNHQCIQDILAAKSRCKTPVCGRIPPVHRVESFRFESPYFNASYVETDLFVIGQDRCYVSEFYWNEDTGCGVLGIDCPWLTFESNRTMYQHWPLQEDTVYSYSFEGTYPLISLTTTLVNTTILDFCNAFTFAYVAQVPKQKIVPQNKPTANFLSRDGSPMDIFERETFYWRASMLARRFVNYMLCDFGCF